MVRKPWITVLAAVGAVLSLSSLAFAAEADVASAGVNYFVASVITAGGAIALAAAACGIGQGLGLKAAVEGIARNPEASGKITTTMLIGLAMIESLAIYALVVSLILIFAHPQTATIAALLSVGH